MDYTALPDSLLLEEVFPYLSLTHLSQLCSINRRFNQICLNDRLWQLRTYHEYPERVSRKPLNMDWRNYYKYLTSVIRQLNVYFNKNKINEKIDLTSGSTIQSLTAEIRNLAQEKGYNIDNHEIKFWHRTIHRNPDTNFITTKSFIIGYSKPNDTKLVKNIRDITDIYVLPIVPSRGFSN